MTPHRLYIICLPAPGTTHARTLDPVTHLTVWLSTLNLSVFAQNSITRPKPHSKVIALQLEARKKKRCDFGSRDSTRKMLPRTPKNLSGAYCYMGNTIGRPVYSYDSPVPSSEKKETKVQSEDENMGSKNNTCCTRYLSRGAESHSSRQLRPDWNDSTLLVST